ncbi:hypothetical protein HMPREF1981_00587 [Bacteroides pyogenes F0041]|uniref:Uncharacterized protein n=1 Tax=Bacteroides pyogenes F0041 TaxID=1321819 RepID=U2E7D2_9BACE|nr:hypothetical protein HMPREF1981_00587 [Bacteroides pyogenes F0041]
MLNFLKKRVIVYPYFTFVFIFNICLKKTQKETQEAIQGLLNNYTCIFRIFLRNRHYSHIFHYDFLIFR